ncbi:MAG: hypothetical protein AAFZ49_10515 [Cyanobacteria bacterium J06659_2]
MTTANSLLNSAIPFPQTLPEGYRYLDESIVYNPEQHLALEYPKQTLTLEALGYSKDEIAQCPTNFALSSAIRILSDEGVEALLHITRTLRDYAVGCERIPTLVRGGAYRSRFLRDLCLCPQVTAFLCEIYRTQVAPHSMPIHLGHLNFAPDNIDQAVDKWHYDTIGLDYVLMVSDPRELSGGEFQYFLGTKHEAAALANSGTPIPANRVVSPTFPGPGYAVVLHGNMIVHRAAKLNTVGERITMVNSYVALDPKAPDPCRLSDLKLTDPHHVLLPEWARHKAWLARGRLDRLIEELPFTDDRAKLIAALEEAIADVEAAITDISDDSEGTMIHYGG